MSKNLIITAEQKKEYNRRYYEKKRLEKAQLKEEKKRKEQEQKRKDAYFLKELNSLTTEKQELLHSVLKYIQKPLITSINDNPEILKHNHLIKEGLKSLLTINKVPIPSFIEEEKPVEEYKPIVLTEKMEEDKDNLESSTNIEDNMYKSKLLEQIKEQEEKKKKKRPFESSNKEDKFKNKDVDSFNNKFDEEFNNFMNGIFKTKNEVNIQKTEENKEYNTLFNTVYDYIKELKEYEKEARADIKKTYIERSRELIKGVQDIQMNYDKYENNYTIENHKYLTNVLKLVNEQIKKYTRSFKINKNFSNNNIYEDNINVNNPSSNNIIHDNNINNTSSNNNNTTLDFINNLNTTNNNITEQINYDKLYYNTIETIKKINAIEGLRKPLEVIQGIKEFNKNIDKYEKYNKDNKIYLTNLIKLIDNTIDNFNNN